ncbi:MAG: hypothetical protein ABW186_04225 [Rhodanobacteraceae bacterium]
MDTRALGIGIVLALGAQSSVADEVMITPVKGSDFTSVDNRRLTIYDALAADSSPRTQVLAARLSFDQKDLHLRPKVSEVVARATTFGSSDAFTQWVAADAGHYWSSQCGPMEYPEAAVAAIARLEPDNAAAISYTVALAQAKGDARAVDDALARMAVAKRADDHRGEEIAAWRAVYNAHPDATIEAGVDASVRDQDALSNALMHATLESGASSALSGACKPDAQSDNPWQRLGRCVDAGLLLARNGNSFALRDEGIAMLKSVGATREDLGDLERDVAWLKANSPNTLVNFEAAGDDPSDIAADWRGTPGEIEATMRRLARLGLPTTPPTGWVSPSDVEAAAESRQQSMWRTYMEGLVEEMRGSADPHEKAVGLSSAVAMTWLPGAKDADIAAKAGADRATLTALAASHRDDVLVNWIAAGYSADGAEPDAATLANLQRIDGTNAATWALSFGEKDADAGRILARMSSVDAWDEHYIDLLGIWNRAIERHGVPDELVATASEMSYSSEPPTRDYVRATIAVMFATAGSIGSIRYQPLSAACTNASQERRSACIAVAHRMFGSNTLLTVRIGARLLRTLDALDENDRARDRQLAWWSQNAMSVINDARYVDDSIASKSEIESLRRVMVRAGKLDPPADWQSPAQQRESKAGAK